MLGDLLGNGHHLCYMRNTQNSNGSSGGGGRGGGRLLNKPPRHPSQAMKSSHISQVQEWDANMFTQRGFARGSFERGFFQYKSMRESRRPVPDYAERNREKTKMSGSYWFDQAQGRPRLLTASFSTPLPQSLAPAGEERLSLSRPSTAASSRPDTAASRRRPSSAAGPDRRVDGMGIVYHPEKQRRASTSGTGRGGQGLLRAGGGRGAERERPGSAWKRRGDVGDGGDDADGGEEEHQLKMTAYVDHVYKVGRAFDLEGQERKIVEYNREKVRKKVELGSARYSEAFKRRKAVHIDAQGTVFAVHTRWSDRKWVFTPVQCTVEEILHRPMQYILLQKKEFLHFGEGMRELNGDEAQNLDRVRTRIALDSRLVTLLRLRQVDQAMSTLKTLPMMTPGAAMSAEQLASMTDTRRRQLLVRQRPKSAGFPTATLYGPPGANVGRSKSSQPGRQMTRRASSNSSSSLTRPNIGVPPPSEKNQEVEEEGEEVAEDEQGMIEEGMRGGGVPVYGSDVDCSRSEAATGTLPKRLSASSYPDKGSQATMGMRRVSQGAITVSDDSGKRSSVHSDVGDIIGEVPLGSSSDGCARRQPAGSARSSSPALSNLSRPHSGGSRPTLSRAGSDEGSNVVSAASADCDGEGVDDVAADDGREGEDGMFEDVDEDDGVEPRDPMLEMTDSELLALLMGIKPGEEDALTIQEVMAKHEHERLHPPPPVPEGGGEEQAGWSVAGDLSVEVASPGKSPGKEGRGGSVVAQAGGEVGLGGEGGAEEKEGSDGAGAGEKGVGKERHIITEENVLLGGLPASMPSSLKSLIPEDTEGTVRSLEWTYSLARKIIESKLMGDAVDRSSLRPFVRLSAYIEQWMARRFGLCHVPKRSGLVAKNMADLSASLEAHHSNSPFLAVFRACANEIIPPSRTFVYTGCSVILRAVSRMAVEEEDATSNSVPVPYTPVEPAVEIASAVLRGAPRHISESLLASIDDWSLNGRIGGVEGTWINYESILEAVVMTYDTMRRSEAQKIVDAYEDLLFELSRGLPCDGEKGRPLGRAITLVQMKKFAFEQYSGMNEAMWESALVSMVANGAIAQGLEEDVWMSLDALLSMDAAFDFQGYEAPWRYSLAPPDNKIVMSGQEAPLMAMTSVPSLSLASGHGESIKSAMVRMVAASSREKFQKPRPSTAQGRPSSALSRPSSSKPRPRSAVKGPGTELSSASGNFKGWPIAGEVSGSGIFGGLAAEDSSAESVGKLTPGSSRIDLP